MALQSFLKENLGETEPVCVKLSERLEEFTLRPLSAEEDEGIRRRCTVRVSDGRGGTFPECDPNKYLVAVAAASVVYPDLDDAELQNSHRAMGREALLMKLLYKHEFDKLCEALTVEGFAELVQRAKN